MAIMDVGPAVTQEAISRAITQMVGTVDLFKQREQALAGLLAQMTDAELVSLGFSQADVTFFRTGMAALDTMVTQGLGNATIKAFTDRTRNFGQ
jgi:predicted secreted protein